MRRAARIVMAAAAILAVGAAMPTGAMAHALDASFESRLPLVAYLAGAAGAVALSFVFVFMTSSATSTGRPAGERGRTVSVPRWLPLGLRALGIIAWLWIVVQGVLGGSSEAEVAPLFLWVYGWVGVALLSAFVGPVWHWLDPFTTLYDIGAWVLRRGGPGRSTPASGTDRDDMADDGDAPMRPALPGGRWPAVAGLAVFIWLELALSGGGSTLFVVVLGYTAVTLAGMVLYGRDAWRADGETFSVWFGLLGRIAPLALDEQPDECGERLRRQGFATGLSDHRWTLPEIIIVALAVGSILFDGLSQTQIFFDIFGAPPPLGITAILAGFLAMVVALAAIAARWVGFGATGAGLLPIAVGYLAAHYLTYLLIDGQRILVAISDPFQQGWDLFGTAFFEPSGAWLPAELVWVFQLLVVIGGHMIGAWAGHAAPVGDVGAHAGRAVNTRLRQVPLAVVMVILTAVTLWSLGQAVVKPPADEVASAPWSASALSGHGQRLA